MPDTAPPAAPTAEAAEAPDQQPAAALDLAEAHADLPDAFTRAPIIDRIQSRTLDLIRRNKAIGCSNAEVGMFLEVAAHYDLDPFANEIWCSKDNQGRLLLMVARDGLRKIAQRNGLDIDCDVVRENDTFKVVRDSATRERTVFHSYEGGSDKRGQIIGAWAETWDASTGKARGYFFAPMHEYRPTSEGKLKYSPWGSQESVMILAAAERQSLRQATPLGGLLADGEMDLNNERATLTSPTGSGEPASAGDPADWQPPTPELAERVSATIARAREVGHVALSDAATVEVALSGQPEEAWKAWLEKAASDLEGMEPPEAEVVDAEPVAEEEEDHGGDPAKMEARAMELADEADAAEVDDPERAEALRSRAHALHVEAAARADENQGTLGDDGVEF